MANETSKLIDRTITEVDLSTGVTEIGEMAFAGCDKIDRIIFGPGITRIGSFGTYNVFPREIVWNCVNATADGYFYFNGDYLERLTFGEGVEAVNFFLLKTENTYGSDRLLEVTFPTTIRSLVSYMLYGCISLSSISFWATTPPTLGKNSLNYTNDCPIYVPAASVDAYKAASTWADYKTRIVGVADGAANWVQTSYSCEINPQTGKKTGNAQVAEMDNNPTSPTYGQTRTVTEQDFTLCQAAFVAVTDVSQVTTGKYLLVDIQNTGEKALDASLIASTTANNNGINASTNYATVAYDRYDRIVADTTSLNAAMEYDATNQKLSWTDTNTDTKYYLYGIGTRTNRRNFNYTNTTTMPSENITVYEDTDRHTFTFNGSYNGRTIYLKRTADGVFGWSQDSPSGNCTLYKLVE